MNSIHLAVPAVTKLHAFYFRLVAYELLYESPSNHRERMKVIISSQFLYFFGDNGPPDPKTLDSKISLDELAECRPAKGKASKICFCSWLVILKK